MINSEAEQDFKDVQVKRLFLTLGVLIARVYY